MIIFYNPVIKAAVCLLAVKYVMKTVSMSQDIGRSFVGYNYQPVRYGLRGLMVIVIISGRKQRPHPC